MRSDFFQDRKCVHVKIDKDVHAALRARLFQCNISMQEFFDEFAKVFVSDDVRATRVIDQLIERKLRAQLAGESKITFPKRRVNELDHDALYSMIEDGGPASTDEDF